MSKLVHRGADISAGAKGAKPKASNTVNAKRPKPLSTPVIELDRHEIITAAAAKSYTGNSISILVREPGACRIYGKKDKSLWAVVSPEDQEFFLQWSWSYARSPWGKLYLCRRTTTGKAAVIKRDGFTYRQACAQKTIYLHREVVLRAGNAPPSANHKIAGHINGNSLDCRRRNLKWMTYSENNSDQHGRYEDVEDYAA